MEPGQVQESAEIKTFKRARLEKKLAGLLAYVDPFKGLVFEGRVAVSLCRALLDAAGLDEDKAPALEVSMTDRHGVTLDRRELMRICLFFNANSSYIEQNQIIPRWTGSPPQWVVATVSDYTFIKLKDRLIMSLRCPVLTGLMAGTDLILDFPPEYVRWLIKEIGCPKYDNISEKEISGMLLLVKAGITLSGKIGALIIRASPGIKKANRELHKARILEHCSKYRHACCNCLVGRDECPMACRTETITKEIELDE